MTPPYAVCAYQADWLDWEVHLLRDGGPDVFGVPLAKFKSGEQAAGFAAEYAALRGLRMAFWPMKSGPVFPQVVRFPERRRA